MPLLNGVLVRFPHCPVFLCSTFFLDMTKICSCRIMTNRLGTRDSTWWCKGGGLYAAINEPFDGNLPPALMVTAASSRIPSFSTLATVKWFAFYWVYSIWLHLAPSCPSTKLSDTGVVIDHRIYHPVRLKRSFVTHINSGNSSSMNISTS